jgi:L-threonylcarbamoyladenylate synthase
MGVSQVFEVDPDRPAEAGEAIDAAARAIRAGELVVMPTETVYGVAARSDDRAATSAIFEAKHRPAGLSLPVLAATAEAALELGAADARAARLAEALWPGPLTMVLTRSGRSADWWLGDESETIGLRVPNHAIAGALLHICGPLAVTSANRSGRPPLSDRDALLEEFGDRVAVYLVMPQQPEGIPSTMVSLVNDEIRILRHGAISEKHIREVLEVGR